MAEEPDIFGQGQVAWLRIDSRSGLLVGGNPVAADLLDTDIANLVDGSWREVLGASDCAGPLGSALASGRRTPLSPFLLQRPNAGEIVLGGMVLPLEAGHRCLLLWSLLEAKDTGLPDDLGPKDVVAALGVERVSPAGQDPAELMEDIRSSLFGILRNRDHIAQPVDNTVLLVLKDLDLDAALDISRALLSHLHSLPALAPEGVPGVRLGIGLAPVVEGASPLQMLLAANNAMLCLRYREDAGRIRVAAAGDAEYLAGLAANPFALFSDSSQLRFEQLELAAGDKLAARPLPQGKPLEQGIDGYVVDNMEGAVDQAIFLAGLDVPVAIIGPGGTGKLYIARIIQQQSETGGEALVVLDCREFRSRADANKRIASALAASQGKTLVFKSPHLMSQEVQVKLARQLSSRTLADVSPPEYLPHNQMVALFPEELERLVNQGKLAPQLASVFAGYPIHVPPIRDRKQAVLRWAHKILAQEGEQRRRELKGFTQDAEQAMLQHDWPGNITEMRQCIVDALDRTDKAWITPVDLGLYKGIRAEGGSRDPESMPFLAILEERGAPQEAYTPSSLEAVDLALGEAVNNLVASGDVRPLGSWAEDDMVLAALERYRGNPGKAAGLLHTRSRNISRWLPKIESREADRNSYPLWQESRRLLREWVRDLPLTEESPMERVQDRLLEHVQRRSADTSVAERAGILGVSVPTYHKRLRAADAE